MDTLKAAGMPFYKAFKVVDRAGTKTLDYFFGPAVWDLPPRGNEIANATPVEEIVLRFAKPAHGRIGLRIAASPGEYALVDRSKNNEIYVGDWIVKINGKTAAGGAKKVAKKILNTAKLELTIWRPLHDNDRLYAVRFGNLKA